MKVLYPSRAAATFLAAALGLAAGCARPDNPTIAEAPPYVAPPTTATPPKVTGSQGSYQYGTNSSYKDAMEKMNGATGSR